MKIWILIFSAALFVGGTCLGVVLQPRIAAPAPPPPKAAVDPGWSGRHPEFSPTRFVSELSMSDEQERELDAIMSESQGDMQALGRAMRAAQDKSRDRIRSILTEDQKKKFEELLSAERQKRSESELNRTVALYQKALALDETQTKAFRAVYAESRNRRREHGKPGADHGQVRKSIREDQNRAVEQALTADQYKQYLVLVEFERNDR
jgi:Spy/CpxP family protein refolding chaperone